ncbi:MAG: hypothetical protein HY722_13910 [Planctomycetes bacterium]|nr:hypothetical protein [Planctomycetota bacterium]
MTLLLAGAGARGDGTTFVLKDGRELAAEAWRLEGDIYVVGLADGSEVRVREDQVRAMKAASSGRSLDTVLATLREVSREGDRGDRRRSLAAIRHMAEVRGSYPFIKKDEAREAADLLVALGEGGLARKDYEVAAEAFGAAARYDDERAGGLGARMARVQLDWAQDLVERRDLTGAIRCLQTARGWDPALRDELKARVVDLWVRVGDFRRAAADWEGALEAYGNGAQMDPGNVEALEGIEQTRYGQVQALVGQGGDDVESLRRRAEAWGRYLEVARNERLRQEAQANLATLRSRIEGALGAEGADAAQRYFPLAAHSWWKYEGADFTDTVSIVDVRTEGMDLVATFTVVSEQRVNATGEGEVARTTTTDLTQEFVRSRDAIYQVGGSRRQVRMKLPIEVGMRWEERRGIERITWTYVSDSERVATRGGAFEDCLLVRQVVDWDTGSIKVTLPPMKVQFYYAPDVGLVKVDWLSRPERSFELVAFEVVKE